MGFFDFLQNKGNTSDAWKKTLVKDLVLLTAVDGDMDEDEVKLVLNIAVNELGFSQNEFINLMKNLGDVKDIYPTDPVKKLEYMMSLIRMTYSDGYIDENEIAYMEIIANKMGLPEDAVQKTMLIIENEASRSLKIKSNNEYLDINSGMRLKEAEVDIMFIVKNNRVIYVNYAANHLFIVDKDGDKKLDGRIVKFDYKSKNDLVEVFIAFNESDSYTMFTMGAPTGPRFNYVAQAVLEYFYENDISNVFIFTEEYSLQFEHAFKLYQKEQQYFMVNNSQSKAFIINKNQIQRSYDRGNSVDVLKELFW